MSKSAGGGYHVSLVEKATYTVEFATDREFKYIVDGAIDLFAPKSQKLANIDEMLEARDAEELEWFKVMDAAQPNWFSTDGVISVDDREILDLWAIDKVAPRKTKPAKKSAASGKGAFKYRVIFTEQTTYEVEFATDLELSTDDEDELFATMDAAVPDWFSTGGMLSVDERELISLKRIN